MIFTYPAVVASANVCVEKSMYCIHE